MISSATDASNGVVIGEVTLRIESPQNVPAELFLLQRVGDADEMVTVCMPNDLTEYNTTRPAADAAVPYYRASEVTFTTDIGGGVGNFVINIRRRLELLCEMMVELEQNETDTVYLISRG